MAIGNLLPRVRPNVAIGIRTSRTLRDRDAWLRAKSCSWRGHGGTRMAEVKRFVEERHGAIIPGALFLAITGFGWAEVTRSVGTMRRSRAFR
jgi:hypothetical protein